MITCLEVTACLLRAELLAQREAATAAASDDAEERLQSVAERFLRRKLRTQRCRVLHSSLCCPQAGTAALQELSVDSSFRSWRPAQNINSFLIFHLFSSTACLSSPSIHPD